MCQRKKTHTHTHFHTAKKKIIKFEQQTHNEGTRPKVIDFRWIPIWMKDLKCVLERVHIFFRKVDVLFFPMLIFLVHFLSLHDSDLFLVLNRVGNFIVADSACVFSTPNSNSKSNFDNVKKPHSWCDAQICAIQTYIVCACTTTCDITNSGFESRYSKSSNSTKKRVRLLQCSMFMFGAFQHGCSAACVSLSLSK